MHYLYRKVNGCGRDEGELSEKQRVLWEALLERLALDLKKGVLPCFSIGSDEFGLLFSLPVKTNGHPPDPIGF